MKGKCTRGFGIITDPETGDEINVEDTFEVSEPVFQRLRETYPGIEQVVDPPDESVKDEHLCGVEKSDGEPCSREVESEDATCWQH